jgi:D-3-phosphoglycerate dehydrogenase / 2-oxoglutarate reductase
MKVVITTRCHTVLQERLQKAGYEVLYKPSVTYEELYTMADDVTGLVVSTRVRIERALLEKAAQLRWIGRLGSGLELIDVPFARSKGIQVINSPEGNRDAVGEHASGHAPQPHE